MNENPSLTSSKVSKDSKVSKGHPVIAVIVAIFFDFIASILGGSLVSYLHFDILGRKGIPAGALIKNMQNQELTYVFQFIIVFLGCLITVLSGYLCARIAKRSVYISVTVFLLISILLTDVFSGQASMTSTEKLILPILTAISGYVGAWLYLRKT